MQSYRARSALRFGRFALSIWILFHLACLLLLPNSGSFAGRRLLNILTPYANSVGAHNYWNFFSPDPAHTMYFRYQVYFENEYGDEQQEPLEGFIPPEKTAIVVNSSERRKLYAMRYLMLNPQRLEDLIAPWICKSHARASRLSITHQFLQLPSLDKAVTAAASSVDDLKVPMAARSLEFNCREFSVENSL